MRRLVSLTRSGVFPFLPCAVHSTHRCTSGPKDPPPCASKQTLADSALSSAAAGPPLRSPALPPSDFPENAFLKCIEKEIQDEALRLDKEEGPPPPPAGWEMYHAEGTSLFYGRRWWIPPTSISTKTGERKSPRVVERHTIRVQLTTRDASLDPECDVRGEHFPFSIFMQRHEEGTGSKSPAVSSSSSFRIEDANEEKDLYDKSIEIRADFVDGELVVDNVVFHGEYDVRIPPISKDELATSTRDNNKDSNPAEEITKVRYNNIFSGYPGPNLDEAEEEVLDGLQAWLAERCIDDQFGEFVGQYSVWVEQLEYERWLRQLRDFVAA